MAYRCVLRNVVLACGAICFLVLLAAPRPAAAQGGEPRYFAIRNARIVPVSGPVIEGGTIVIARGIIAAVGKDIPVPPEAWVIDGKGLTVYPGLIDSFTDLGLTPPPAAPAAPAGAPAGPRAQVPISRGPEDRPATTPWASAADEIKADDKRIETWRNAGFTTAVTSPRVGIFPGQSAVIDLAGGRPGEMVVRASAAVPVSLQPSGSFVSFPGSLMGVLAYVHQVFIDTEWFTKAEAIYEKHPAGAERVPYDRTEATLAEALEDRALVLIPANNDIQLLRALDLADRWRVRAAIYGGQQAYEVAGAIAAKKLPVLVNLKWPEKEKDADPAVEESLRTLRFRDRAPSSPAALGKAGVKFAFYSGGITAPKDILKAAKKAVDAGLSEDAALRAFTIGAAEIFGLADRLGSIDAGKIANLVVADGNLFNEKTKVKMVFVDGEKFEVREPARPTEPPKGDLSGRWKLSYTTPEGPEEATADLTMASDGTLFGTITGPRGTTTLITGWVSADKFSFTINIPVGPETADVTFTGTFEGTTMKGTISVQGLTIEFTGAKPGSSSAAAAESRGQR